MDRSRPSAPERSAAVRVAGRAALDLLLPAAAGERGEPAPHAKAGPVVHEAAVFRQPQDGRRVRRGPPSCPAADAHFGNPSALPQTASESPGSGPPDLSVPATRRSDPAAQPRLEHRYYLHSHAWRLPVSGGGDGLVQPVRAQLGTVQHDGDRLLPGRTRRGLPLRPTRNLELRPGLAVHCGRLPGSAQTTRHPDQHGWPRPCARQRVHRTAVALAQVRADLPRRLRQRSRSVPGAGKLLPLLQPPAPAPGARIPDAGGPVPAQIQKEKGTLLMGDAVPQTPWDLALLFSRMHAFRFTRIGACRTIDLLARRIGLSRDGTRAPMQVRNGRRPHGRLLGHQPAALSKDGRFFVQPTRTTLKCHRWLFNSIGHSTTFSLSVQHLRDRRIMLILGNVRTIVQPSPRHLTQFGAVLSYFTRSTDGTHRRLAGIGRPHFNELLKLLLCLLTLRDIDHGTQ